MKSEMAKLRVDHEKATEGIKFADQEKKALSQVIVHRLDRCLLMG